MRESLPAPQETLTTFYSQNLTPDSMWCEQTHLGGDMSGFATPERISQPSDEQYIFGYSPEQYENDCNSNLNSENPSSPQDNVLELQDIYSENILEDDSNMFDNSNYSELDKEIKIGLPSNSETNEFVKTTTPSMNSDFLQDTCTESSLDLPLTIKEEKRPSTVKSRHLSIFDKEEPLIKEETDVFTMCSGESKVVCDIKYELEVAAEEEVVTEEPCSSPQSPNRTPNLDSYSPWFDSATLALCKEEPESPVECPEDFLEVSNFPSSQELMVDWSTGPLLPPSANQEMPQLQLDIGAALVEAGRMFGEGLPDTPEVLKPVLKPLGDFDLISFLLANGDSNNNNNNPELPATSVKDSENPVKKNSLLERRRKGKSRLSMQELRASLVPSRKTTCTMTTNSDHIEQPLIELPVDPLTDRLFSESTYSFSTSNRPRRESASRFNKRLEEGLLQDVPVAFSDEEEDLTSKSKRKRTVSSSSSRNNLSYDSDISSFHDSYQKYREKRDKNNISSKISRQKRKVAQQKKMAELKELEKENLRLKKMDNKLSVTLERVQRELKKYLDDISK